MHMYPAQKKGVTFSGILHVVLIILAIVGLPTLFWSDPKFEEPTAITVDILPIAAMSNVRPSSQKPVKPVEEKKPAVEPAKDIIEKTLEDLKEEKAKDSPVVKTEESKPAEPKKVEDPDAPEVKKEDDKKEEKKEEKKEDPLDAILKGVKDTAASQKKAAPATESQAETSEKSSRSNNFDPNSAEALSIRDAIQNQIYRCWNVPAGAMSAEELIIQLQIDYDQLGNPTKVVLAAESIGRYSTDTFFRAAADSAIRAVKRCSPLEGLPAGSYSIWQYIDMSFNPKDVL